MLNIIFLIITGSFFVYLSKDNLSPVTLSIAQYTIPGIPLYFVIVGSLLIGLILSYIVQILGGIANSFILRGNQKIIKLGQDEVLNLTKRIHQLELENEKLKHNGPAVTDANAL